MYVRCLKAQTMSILNTKNDWKISLFYALLTEILFCFFLKFHARNSDDFMYFTLNVVGNIIFSGALLIATYPLFNQVCSWGLGSGQIRTIFGSDGVVWSLC